MKTIAIVSPKGGVGKSTISASLALALNRGERPVLSIDLDPQNALRYHLGNQGQPLDGVSRATLEGRSWRQGALQLNGGMAVLPYGQVNEHDRKVFEQHLSKNPNWLRSNIASLPLASDTLVVVDTPPGPSVYLRQALSTADLVIVVMLSDAASYATVPQIESLIDTYCSSRPEFISYAYLVNQFNPDRQLSVDILQSMRDNLPNRAIGLVRYDPAVADALAQSQSIIDYAPDNPVSQDIKTWAEWVRESTR